MEREDHQADSALIVAMWIVLSEQINEYIALLIGLLFAANLVIRTDGVIPLFQMPGREILYAFLFWGSGLGLVNILLGRVGWWPVLRDAVRMGKVLLYWFVCAYLSERNRHDRNFFYRTMFIACVLSAAYSVAVKGSVLLGGTLSFDNFREAGNPREFSLVLGCYLSLFLPECCSEGYLSKGMDMVGKVLIFTALLLSFSRTVYVLILCMFLLSLREHTGRVIWGLVLVAAVAILAAACFPEAAEQFWEKMRNSISETNSRNTRWTGAQIVKNWRGYEIHCAQVDFRNADFLTQLFGKGFGGGIDAFGYAYLVTGEDSLPYLHNGYYTTGFKFGILGILFMSVYYLQFLLYAVRVEQPYDRKLVVGTVLAFYLSTTVISGILWGGAELFSIMVLAWHTSYGVDESTEDRI